VALQFFSMRAAFGRKTRISRERSYTERLWGSRSFLEGGTTGARVEGVCSRVVSSRPRTRIGRPRVSQADSRLSANELGVTIQRVGPDLWLDRLRAPSSRPPVAWCPAPPVYSDAVRAVCDRHARAAIADEVRARGACGTWRPLEP